MEEEDRHVLPETFGRGPVGLGDPNDKSLRRVEKDVMIPQKMKAKGKLLCPELVKGFGECAKQKGLLMPFLCRKQAKQLENCLTRWYNDEKFKEECTQEYLKERTEFRTTGIKKAQKKKEAML